MISTETLLLSLTIFCARVVDVSLSTIRQVMIIRGKRAISFGIAFVENLIWVFAVSKVLQDLSEPITAFAFALGFATGTFVGITLEGKLLIGEQVVKVFTSMGDEVADYLRSNGYRLTEFMGKGRDGDVSLLFVQVRRRDAQKVSALARELDPACFLLVEDIRFQQRAAT